MKTKTNVETEIKENSKLFSSQNNVFSKYLKKELKKNLLTYIGVKKNTRRLLIGIVLKKNDNDMNYLFEEIMQGLYELDINVIVLGDQKNHYGFYNNIYYLEKNSKHFRMITEGCDLILFPDTETEDKCLKNGTPCIFLNSDEYRGNLINYMALEETGNGISVSKKSPWILFQSICRALETYSFPYDWETMCKNAFETGTAL